MTVRPTAARKRRATAAVRTDPVMSEEELAEQITGEPAPPIGHNAPPRGQVGMTEEQWYAWINHVFEAPDDRAVELLASFERFRTGFPTIETQDVQGRAGDLKDKIQALLKQAEALHTIEKAPILLASKVVDGKMRGFRAKFMDTDSKGRLLDRSEAPINVIVARQTDFARRMEAANRKAAEEEAQRKAAEAAAAADAAAETMAAEDLQEAAAASKAAEQAAAVAAGPAADLARTHGPMGSVTSLRTNWRFHPEESDLMALARSVVAGDTPLAYLAFNETRIGVAVRTEKVREIPGCVIRADTTAV